MPFSTCFINLLETPSIVIENPILNIGKSNERFEMKIPHQNLPVNRKKITLYSSPRIERLFLCPVQQIHNLTKEKFEASQASKKEEYVLSE